MSDVAVTVEGDNVNVTIGEETVTATIGDNNVSVTIGETIVTSTIAADTVTVTVGDILQRITFLNEGEKLRFDGPTGDSFIVYQNGRLELHRDGNIKHAW